MGDIIYVEIEFIVLLIDSSGGWGGGGGECARTGVRARGKRLITKHTEKTDNFHSSEPNITV